MDSRNYSTFTDFMDDIISKQLPNHWSFNRFANMTPPGLVLEFGVAEGQSITDIAYTFPDRLVHGFDSFEGLPEDWNPSHPAGKFKCDVPAVPSNVILYKGLFSDTLPGFLEAYQDPIAFLHMDADLYSSTAYVLKLVEHRIANGAIITFDELHHTYGEYKEDEYKAFDEFIARTGFHAISLERRMNPEAYCFQLVR
jgi:hypothetical protein